jgi:hypothetical protein
MASDYDPAKQYLVRHAVTLYLGIGTATNHEKHHTVGTNAIYEAATDL